MSESPRVFVLEVEGGRALPSTLRWLAGVRVEPISVGTQGQWFIVGPGVHAVHAYLAFDGATLYVQSADPRYPLLLDGAPVGSQWQAVPTPARVAMGGVVIAFSASDASDDRTQVLPETDHQPAVADEDRTRYDPVEIPAPARDALPTRLDEPDFEDGAPTRRHPAPLAHAPFADGDATRVDMDATRVDTSAPVQSTLATGMPQTIPEAFPAPRVPSVRPAAGMPAAAQVPSVVVAQPAPHAASGPAIVDLPPAPPPTPAVKTRAERAKELWAQFLVQWKAASLAKKATVALLPVAFFAVYVLFGDNQSQAQRARPAPHASASATASAPPQASTPATVAPPPSVPATQAPASATPPPPPSTPAPPTARKAPERPSNTSRHGPSSAPAEPPAPPGGKTPERLAVDAVVAGAYADAARRYETLAREHPDKPVYEEAARILRSKLDAGTP